MSRRTFDRIFAGVIEGKMFLGASSKTDAVGELGASPSQKFVAAMRQLVYGIGAAATDEYCRPGEPTGLQSLQEFSLSVVRVLGPEHLREQALQGMHQGKERMLVLRLEVICDLHPFVWHMGRSQVQLLFFDCFAKLK